MADEPVYGKFGGRTLPRALWEEIQSDLKEDGEILVIYSSKESDRFVVRHTNPTMSTLSYLTHLIEDNYFRQLDRKRRNES